MSDAERESFEPEVIEWADGTEYVFDDEHSMERELARRLERGEEPEELRDELLARGSGEAAVEEAFLGAEVRREAMAKDGRRQSFGLYFVRFGAAAGVLGMGGLGVYQVLSRILELF